MTQVDERFDFSRDAAEFRERLAQQLRQMKVGAVALDDDDLEWVNAAGMVIAPEDKDKR